MLSKIGNILIVDDNQAVCETLTELLSEVGYDISFVCSAEKGFDLLNNAITLPDLIFIDIILPGINGLDFLRCIKRKYPNIIAIVITGQPTLEMAIKALQNGANNFVLKPFDLNEVLHITKKMLQLVEWRNQDLETQKYIISEFTAELPTHLEHITGLIHFVLERTILTDCYPLGVCEQIGLALDEALNNAMEHGNKLNPDKKVKIECHISKAKFTIKVQDEGKGFDVNNLPNPFANISRSRGRGIFICKNIMDEIHFTNNGSEITIVKYNPLFSNSNNK